MYWSSTVLIPIQQPGKLHVHKDLEKKVCLLMDKSDINCISADLLKEKCKYAEKGKNVKALKSATKPIKTMHKQLINVPVLMVKMMLMDWRR